MKKLIIAFLIAICIIPVFAETTTQTLELVLYVPEVEPVYSLDVVGVEGGKVLSHDVNAYRILRTSTTEKVSAMFAIRQINDSRWKGVIDIIINTVDNTIMRFNPVASNVTVVANNDSELVLEVCHNGKGKLPHTIADFTVATSATESFVYLTYTAP